MQSINKQISHEQISHEQIRDKEQPPRRSTEETEPARADHGPYHLAQAVRRALSVSGREAPEQEVLSFFFDALYETSFKPGSGMLLRGRVVWQETGSRPDPVPSGFLLLAQPVPLSAGSLTSLLAGLEAPSILLVSAGKSGFPVIWGIHPDGKTLAPPPLFEAEVRGAAHLRVEAGLDYPLELRRNRLRFSAQEVFGRGPVRERLAALFADVFPSVQALLPGDVAASPLLNAGSFPLPGGAVLMQEQDWPDMMEQLWVHALIAVLGEIDALHTGGLVLLNSRRENLQSGDCWAVLPQEASFSRLRQGLEQRVAAAIVQQVRAVQALAARAASLQDLPPEDLALQEPVLSRETVVSDPELRAAARLLASLTRLGGPLRLGPHLDLLSFGGQPGLCPLPDRVYLAGDETASDLTPISSRSFGPRNQALLRLCRQDPESVGFAFTQDGDLRAILCREDRLLVWNNVLLPRS